MMCVISQCVIRKQPYECAGNINSKKTDYTFALLVNVSRQCNQIRNQSILIGLVLKHSCGGGFKSQIQVACSISNPRMEFE